MGLLRKLFVGGPDRKSRLHDHLGNRVSAATLVTNGPKAIFSGALRLTFGKLPARPWISYDGQDILASHLNKNSRILEFGSGTSTQWYSERCAFLLSHEDNPEWFDLVGERVGEKPHVVRRLCRTKEEYCEVPAEFAKGGFDLIMVDGNYRDQCIEDSIPLLADGGILYLDNSDKSYGDRTGDIPAARQRLVEYAQDNGYGLRFIVDFASAQLFASEAVVVFKTRG